MNVSANTLKFKHPFTALVSGPTSCGKTHFVRKLLDNHRKLIHINQPEKLRILWCYGIDQRIYQVPIPNCSVTYMEGVPTSSEITENLPDIVVLDDLMSESSSATEVSHFFTRGSHHLGFSIILIVQNIFAKGKEMRNISLNSQIIVLMKNRRDLKQINTLGQQLFPSKVKNFMAVYADATKFPYSYLVIDTTQETPEELRLRSDIIPKEGNSDQTVYTI